MIIDCDECAVRGPACGDCVVTVLLGGRPDSVLTDDEVLERMDLDDTEQQAVQALAAAGLIPPLRMVPLRMLPSTKGERVVTLRRRSAG